MTLGDGIEEIGGHAFWNCTSLEQIVIPNDGKRIKNGTFRGCSRLTTVQLGNGLEETGVYAFSTYWNCPSLEQIVVPNANKMIKIGIFKGCSRLTTVQLGNGLAGGDWGVCVQHMQIATTHRHTPHCQDSRGKGT